MTLKSKIHSSIGSPSSPIKILLINPNSTQSFTLDLVPVLTRSIPSDVSVDFITAPEPAPASINNNEDCKLSTRVCEEHLDLDSPDSAWLEEYSCVVVACFSQHPLVDSLKRAGEGGSNGKSQPAVVLGILDAAINSALGLGGKFGIVTTGQQWETLFDQAIASMGLTSRYAGTKGTGFDAISLHGSEVSDIMINASTELVGKSADVIVLGCGGMSNMRAMIERELSGRIGRRIPVVDGVQAAVDMGIGYARMGIAPSFSN
ncbi:uncharacterized protein I303_105151 [Kwoniella dejecticola CBS 10117]|uniref:DCG1 protein n=1 Tax=Kwoniella dejecticola CBS 10117 TaxID=1296121 RepID=A0A1A6A3B7_9TREE|nr:uncharacterized protein I303_05403 [Kwoniella dejecticola CBS 10117]OBR84544.1 hypothetical protein I303_05403 [Kwoniella dejecticola CBS 10117]